MMQETLREKERRIDDEEQMKALREYNRQKALKKANQKPFLIRIKEAFKRFSR